MKFIVHIKRVDDKGQEVTENMIKDALVRAGLKPTTVKCESQTKKEISRDEDGPSIHDDEGFESEDSEWNGQA